jgi:ribosomal-protein-alanine N-acetyltransferase
MSNLSAPEKGVYLPPPITYDAADMSEIRREIIICPMTGADLGQVMLIEQASYPAPWSRQHFLNEIEASYAFPLSAFDSDGRLIGFICPMLILDEGHILNVAVSPEYRGMGVGRLLVERVIEDCRRSSASFVSLEVRVSNHAALRLYHDLGFKETGRRKRYYENGEDAIMMECLLSG